MGLMESSVVSGASNQQPAVEEEADKSNVNEEIKYKVSQSQTKKK